MLQRFTRWFTHNRSGTLWEEMFKSVIVESGTAARTMAAYIDLNPVRAGMVEDPADYRWSGYGEAVGGRVKGYGLTRSGAKGNGKKAREGLVRAITSDTDTGFDASKWKEASRRYRRYLGMALGRKTSNFKLQTSSRSKTPVAMNEAEYLEGATEDRPYLPELTLAKMLRCRVRYLAAYWRVRGGLSPLRSGSRTAR